MFERLEDARLRVAAFDWLSAQVDVYGDSLSRSILAEGFEFQGQRVPLLGPQGIFKPAAMALPLSITTSPNSPYNDAFGADGLLHYRYRGTDPDHRDNRGLRFTMEERLPLVYFHGLVPGRYFATWPVYVAGDSPELLAFSIAVDDASHAAVPRKLPGEVAEGTDARRRYVTSLTRRRLHQRAFRERVLEAYRHQCALCRLRHDELLDAAHIIPDAEPEGEPVVRNGLALCGLHHLAYDRFFISVRPDYVIEVRPDVLEEHDGPTLRYAIQGLHGSLISLPRQHEHLPSIEHLTTRHVRFLELANVR
ncbi:MAG: HNH endonuclease [Dehalococcoidia bacterium]|jgi:putative restriction endonuclease|nr:HNH endonuclease [Dehalococcoidia bacterium]|tara:strand:+ start:205 stop:1125 length:921 start_codon:yes stop_codon:yes gene_type:complete